MESPPHSDEEAVGPVEAALCRLRELPLVKSVFPITGARPGYQAQLWCSAAHRDPRGSKGAEAQVTRERDMLGCVERVHLLVQNEHSNDACLAAAEAARATAAAGAAAAAGPSAPTTAFAAMAAAQQVRPAAERAAAAEQLATEARAAQRAAEARLADANKVVEMAEAEARRLECRRWRKADAVAERRETLTTPIDTIKNERRQGSGRIKRCSLHKPEFRMPPLALVVTRTKTAVISRFTSFLCR